MLMHFGKQLLVGLLLFTFAVPLLSATVDIGSTSITIPLPAGFIPINSKMTYPWKLMESYKGDNVILGAYIPKSAEKDALSGEAQNLDRNINITTLRKSEDQILTVDSFHELQQQVQKMITAHSLRPAEAEELERNNGNLKNLAGYDPHLSQARLIVLPAGHPDKNRFSFSQISINQFRTHDGQPHQLETISTVTIMLIKGKILDCTVAGSAGDLRWTQTTTRAWVDSIIQANQNP